MLKRVEVSYIGHTASNRTSADDIGPTMKGFVLTPRETVDTMVELAFRARPPQPDDAVLDPGCGTGAFIDGIIRWCRERRRPLPRITGVEADPRHIPALRQKYSDEPAIQIQHADFLSGCNGMYDYILGNPPYVPITALSEGEKFRYRGRFKTANGRFDLYLLFFEQALRQLALGGRLVFITPEKYLYVQTAAALREMLARLHVEQIRLVREDTFGELVTYPSITVINQAPSGRTEVLHRDGRGTTIELPGGRGPWLPLMEGAGESSGSSTLKDLCLRVSCGVATGADNIFVLPADTLAPALRPYARPTIAGRELTPATEVPTSRLAILLPYSTDGQLLPLEALGALRRHLTRDHVRARLMERTCVRHKPWYAFHETPPLKDILRPKILCKDIGEAPRFWVDRTGELVPRHSVYYIVPREPAALDAIAAYLKSDAARQWLKNNCQRAARGFLRLQSRVLQRLPVPDDLARKATGRDDAGSSEGRSLHVELSIG